ncbi:MAG: hypothetical protein NXI35_24380 [bacterium]|nr:hypothetical protein [bacterium]
MLIALALAPLLVQPPAVEEAAEAPVLVVRSRADLGLAEATVQRALEGHLADVGYDVHVDFAPEQRPWPPAAVRVELHPAADGGLRVELQRALDPRPWARTLPPEPNPDLRLESLGVLVRSMLSAPLPEPEPAPRPAPEPTPRHAALDLALGYRGDSLAAAHPWHSSVALDVAARTHQGLALGIALAYTPSHAGAALSLQRVGGLLRLGAAFRPTQRLQPAVFAHGHLEGLGWSGAPNASRATPGWALRVGAGASGELRALVRGGWFVSARLGVTAWIRGATLEEQRAEARSTLVRTFPASGTVWAGVGYRWAIDG